MFTCKQVSRVLQNEDYANLSPTRRFFLNLHIKLCAICGKFNKQIIEDQDLCCNYKKQEESLLESQPRLNPEQKDALKQLLAEQEDDSSTP
ncbi:MAG: hypothetical protein ACON46_00870 [Coraliomargaritaceae bacterium]